MGEGLLGQAQFLSPATDRAAEQASIPACVGPHGYDVTDHDVDKSTDYESHRTTGRMGGLCGGSDGAFFVLGGLVALTMVSSRAGFRTVMANDIDPVAVATFNGLLGVGCRGRR